jgi:hypothetical protein
VTDHIIWLDPAAENDAIESQEQTARRVGRTLDTIRNYVRRYPLEYPAPVAKSGSRKMFRRIKDIDAFMEWLETRENTRTPLEVAHGEVVRIELALEGAQKRVKKAMEAMDAATREHSRLKASLKRAREQYDLLNR